MDLKLPMETTTVPMRVGSSEPVTRGVKTANGQAKAANKVILAGLKKRLQDAKGAYAKELPLVLWAYRTTPQSATGETPFRLAYSIEVMIPVQVNKQSPRVRFYDEVGNLQAYKEELKLLPEVQEQTQIREAALKQRMTNKYNKKVIRRSFTLDDLVLIKNDIRLTSRVRKNSLLIRKGHIR
ncbi:uncharacterized protein LOC107487750 [Arachis duranensis]|uniref:Uncharacterized protein LOC107487750 n=1 Tax=Arachis duranensis TaxID=130453 RepID=A0A6P4D8B2_ARADU|nr:uncharacterized protein LOC107487750 [Arachis duranensis]